MVTRAQTQNQGVQSGAQITAQPVANTVASGVPKFTLSSQPVSFTSGDRRIFLAITKVNGNIIKK